MNSRPLKEPFSTGRGMKGDKTLTRANSKCRTGRGGVNKHKNERIN
jgi:hypothetical protein